MPGFRIHIPVPPSVNHLHASGPGGRRYATRHYRQWIKDAGWSVRLQAPWPVAGRYCVAV